MPPVLVVGHGQSEQEWYPQGSPSFWRLSLLEPHVCGSSTFSAQVGSFLLLSVLARIAAPAARATLRAQRGPGHRRAKPRVARGRRMAVPQAATVPRAAAPPPAAPRAAQPTTPTAPAALVTARARAAPRARVRIHHPLLKAGPRHAPIGWSGESATTTGCRGTVTRHVVAAARAGVRRAGVRRAGVRRASCPVGRVTSHPLAATRSQVGLRGSGIAASLTVRGRRTPMAGR